jgi:radical SAM superfamily enzyme YgiQ (UPF0313 family)
LKVLLTTLNAKYTHSSLALRYLKDYCQDVCELELLEFSINNQLLDMLGQIYETKPECIGFACYIWNIDLTQKLIQLVHKTLPNCKIICGGPEVSYEPREFMLRMPEVDYVIQGEGEVTLHTLLDRLKHGEAPEDIEAVTRRDGNGGIVEGHAIVVHDLNRLPFPYHDETMPELVDKIIYYESSRGCPFACQYCLSCATKGVRFLDIERVLAELKFFIRHNVRQVKFVDRTFNAKKSHFMPILKFLAQADCQTNFHFEVAVDYMDADVLAVLKQMPAGRVQLEIGIQSTNEFTLKQVCRVNHWADIVHNITTILGFHNMHLHVDLIIGLPNEDMVSFARSFNDVYALKPDMLQIGFLKMLKGAGITAMAKEHGYVFMNMAPYQVLSNTYMSYGEIRMLHIFEDVFERYYNAGRFRNTIQYVISMMGRDAFAFYEKLTCYWEKRQFHLIAHTTKSLYQYLYDFCQTLDFLSMQDIEQLLLFDALLADHGSIRPLFLPWNQDKYQEETSAFWRGGETGTYISAYAFTNWRDLKKKYHIEVFAVDIITLIDSGKVNQEPTAILFCFAEGKTSYQKIVL